MRLFAKWRLADRLDPVVNVIVSNVPGPREPLHRDRVRLRAIHSVGPILEGLGLNLTVWSYLDRVYVAALAAPTASTISKRSPAR
jgi:diacylglycerol O-acyltransferase